MQDIHDIRPPVPVGFDPAVLKIILMVTGGILVLVLLFFLIQKWLKKRKQSENLKCLPLPLAPYETALRELDLLFQNELTDTRFFYFDLTAILKKYIGRTFHINAVEMTTQEFVKGIFLLTLDKTIKKEISLFCEKSDPIKYAGIVPGREAAKEDLLFIKEKIRQIEEERVKLLAQEKEDH